MKRSEAPRQLDEIVVSIVPRRTRRGTLDPSPTQRTRSYDAVVYGQLPRLAVSGAVRNFPEQIGGLPLAMIEPLTIRWGEYEEYVSWFLRAEQPPQALRDRLLEPLSQNLEQLVQLVQGAATRRPIRIWWHLGSPELEELPWELLAQGSATKRISFARGRPGELLPLVRVQGDLQLAVIGNDGLHELWSQPPDGIAVTQLTGGIRDGLRAACARGFHAVHLTACGSISRGFDSVLRLAPRPDAREPWSDDHMAWPEIQATLNGAQVAILAVSPPLDQQQGVLARSTYRAFAHLGGDERSTTTVVAPIGPMTGDRQHAFWGELYTTLARTFSIEEAVWAANRQSAQPTPVAVFLRHRLGHEFSRRPREPSAPESRQAIEPARLEAELRASREFLDRLAQIQGTTPHGAISDESFADARRSLDSLDRQLDPWREPDGGDE